MSETFDSVILFTEDVSESQSLCINIYMEHVMQFVSFKYKPSFYYLYKMTSE